MIHIPKRMKGTEDCMDMSELDFEVVSLLLDSDMEFIYDWNGKEWIAQPVFGMYEE